MKKGEKKAQRAVLRRARDEVSKAERRSAAAAIVPHFLQAMSLPSVGLYYPVRGEFDCLPLLEALGNSGAETALPVVVKRHAKLAFVPWKTGQELKQGEYEIPSPPYEGLSISPRALIVPLLGYDAKGGRLGYGGGYYDRTLADLREQVDGFAAIGLAYDFQQLDKVVMEPHDQWLDYILTPAGLEKF